MNQSAQSPMNPSPIATHLFGSCAINGATGLIDSDSVRHTKVSPVPLFPISEPNRWISLVDSNGRELLLIEDLEQLPLPLQTIIREELSFRELVPRIHNVVSVSGQQNLASGLSTPTVGKQALS